jgi:uncharacterized membrane protein YphA (DoxX/SURF4 family)
MQRSAIVFLILLRLAIGWHFLFEGIQKVQSVWTGPTVTNRPFSSAGYFSQAPGPLGWAWRWATGDPDDEALARLVVQPLGEKDDPATDKPNKRLPPGLEKEWDAWLGRFTDHYHLDEEQKEQAEAKRNQAAAAVVDWLTYTPPSRPEDQAKDARYVFFTSEQTRSFPSGEVKRRMGMAERIAEYRTKVEEVRDSARKMRLLGKDVEGAKLRSEKAEIARLRAGLLADVDKKTQEMKKAVAGVLTAEQKEEGPVPEPEGRGLVWWVDFLTRWGLVVVGACLMVGLYTRTNAALAAGFLVMTYLAFPSVPWLPAPAVSEGAYVYVNKNVVELLALCVLATTYTGRWFGLDGVLHRGACWVRGRQP